MKITLKQPKRRNEYAMALAMGKFKSGPMLTKLKQKSSPRHAKHKKLLTEY